MNNNYNKPDLESFLDLASEAYKKKRYKNYLYFSKTKISDDTRSFSMLELEKFKKVKLKAQSNVIVNSFDTLFKNQVMVFETTTLKPNNNIETNFNSFMNFADMTNDEYIEHMILHQHSQFVKFQRNFRHCKIKLNSVYTYELSEKFNVHSHKINFMNEEDLKTYIKHIVLSRKKTNTIGRTELKLDIKYKPIIKKIFDNFTIRYGNGTPFKLTLGTYKAQSYYIKQSKLSAGDFIYFEFIIPTSEEDSKYIANYIFKYLNKSYNDHISKEMEVFKYLGIRSIQYSKDFFKYPKIMLFKVVDKLFNLNRSMNIFKDKKDCIAETITYLDSGIVYKEIIPNTKLESYFFKDIKTNKDILLISPFSQYEKKSYDTEYEAVLEAFKDNLNMDKKLTKEKTAIFHLAVYKVQFLKKHKLKSLNSKYKDKYILYLFNQYPEILSLMSTKDITNYSYKKIDQLFIIVKQDFNTGNINLESGIKRLTNEEINEIDKKIQQQYPHL